MSYSKFLIVTGLIAAISFTGCSKDEESGGDNSGSSDTTESNGSGYVSDHGPSVDLGAASVAGWEVKASRTEGDLTKGGETAVDVWVTGGTGSVSAVRFWIGVEDASGSIKALGAKESADDPTHWHGHVEIPSPLPDGSQLWIEIQGDDDAKNATSFDLKQ